MPRTKKENTTKANILAVVDVNGTQLLIQEGEKYEVNSLEGKKGDKYTSDRVLLVAVDGKATVGKPYIKDANVEFEITSQKRGEKIDTYKYTAKSRYRRSYGSRQEITVLLVKKIQIA